jgi:CheY-like chemotaxis protein
VSRSAPRRPTRPYSAGTGRANLLGTVSYKSAGRPVLFVAVTALGDPDSRRRTADAGFALHLVKPVDPDELFRVLESLARVPADAPPDRGGGDSPEPTGS